MFTNVRSRRFLIFAALFLGILAVYMIGLGASPLIDPDEPIYGEFIKEMVRSGNWLTPQFNGEVWFDKPPLIYWLGSICVSIFGLNEFALRLPSAVFGALTAVMVFFLTCHDFGKRAGKLATAVIATALMQIIMVHSLATDSIMVFCMVSSLYCYRRWLDSSKNDSMFWMIGCGIAAGFGLLAKGPSVPMLLVIAYIAHLVWIRQVRRLWSVDVLVAVIAALVVGMPWYIAMLKMHGRLFIEQFLVANNITRFTQPLHRNQAGHWYSHFKTVFVFFVFFLPWNIYLIQAVSANWKTNTGAKLAVCWTGLILLFFSVSKTQNFTYSLPAFPACAVLIGAYLDKVSKAENARGHITAGLSVGVVFAVLFGIALYITAMKKYPQFGGLAVIMSLILLATYAVPLIGVGTRKVSLNCGPWLMAVGMTAFGLAVMLLLTPAVATYLSSRDVSFHIRAASNAKVVSYNLWRPGMLYYSDIMPSDLKTAGEVLEISRCRQPSVLVSEKENDDLISRLGLTKLTSDNGLYVYANQEYLEHHKPGPE